MQRPVVLAVLVVVLLTLALVPAQHAYASQEYSEKITAYVAGSSALWYMSFDGVNATASSIGAVEGEAGVSWYNLTLLKTTSWSSDFQVFGPNGYNLIPVPFVPPQGAFLTVGADSYGTALSAAESLDSYLLASFVSYSNSTGIYRFYTPISFSGVAPDTLLKLIPSNVGGFASAVSASTFANLDSPMASLQGIREGSAFAHNLTLGSIAGSALSSSSRPQIMSYFGSTVKSLAAANMSTSSVIYLKFLDGPVNSSDKAAMVSSSPGTGSYELTLAPRQKVYSLNVTVDQAPELLLARRVVDRGVLMSGQNVSVTMSLSNPSGTTAVKTGGFSDDWWKSYGFFKLVKGNITVQQETILPGDSLSPTYVLEYTGGTPEQIVVPPTSVNYTYTVGSAEFKGTASSNPISFSLGEDNPVVYAFLVPAKNSEGPVGSTQRFNITVKNVGTLTASSDVVDGKQEGGLLAGSSITVPVAVTAQSLTEGMSSKSYAVTYSTPSGQNLTTVTNSIPVLFSHSSMSLGMPTLALGATVTSVASGETNLTLSFAVGNGGSANLTGFVGTGTLPAGLACGTAKSSWVSCSAGEVTLSPPALPSSGSAQGAIEFDLSTPVNYFFAPYAFHATSAGLVLSGESNAVLAPSGIVLTKQFAPSSVFAGMTSTVKIEADNRGPFTAYNATVQSRADSFDEISLFSPLPLKSLQAVGPGGVLNVTYSVIALGRFGNLSSSATTLSMYFGGIQYTISQAGPLVSVYKPVAVSVKASPSAPTEGRPFLIGITIQNPSSVAVSNVRYSLPISSTITVSNLKNAVIQGGNLTVTVGQLAAQQSFVANATAQASSGTSLSFATGTLTFSYSGATVRAAPPSSLVVVGEDVLTRYTIPSALVFIGVLAAALYVRRKLTPISPSNQR